MYNEAFGSGVTLRNSQRNELVDRIDALLDRSAPRKTKASEKGTSQAHETGRLHRTCEGLITSVLPEEGTEGWVIDSDWISRLEEVYTNVVARLTAQGYMGTSQAKSQGREESEEEK